ncbi:MAG: hypothetical protein L3J47_00270 [Sulfurovum sp.]|nr:hypothetical protein [Sulfurovum sp.]
MKLEKQASYRLETTVEKAMINRFSIDVWAEFEGRMWINPLATSGTGLWDLLSSELFVWYW